MDNEKRQQMINDGRAMLDWLEAHPEVRVVAQNQYQWMWGDGDKKDFMAAARSFGTFEKSLEDKEQRICITKKFGTAYITLSIPRSIVCKKVTVLKEVEDWDCDPLLSVDEAAELEAMA